MDKTPFECTHALLIVCYKCTFLHRVNRNTVGFIETKAEETAVVFNASFFFLILSSWYWLVTAPKVLACYCRYHFFFLEKPASPVSKFPWTSHLEVTNLLLLLKSHWQPKSKPVNQRHRSRKYTMKGRNLRKVLFTAPDRGLLRSHVQEDQTTVSYPRLTWRV